jgi:hypothetical protein
MKNTDSYPFEFYLSTKGIILSAVVIKRFCYDKQGIPSTKIKPKNKGKCYNKFAKIYNNSLFVV